MALAWTYFRGIFSMDIFSLPIEIYSDYIRKAKNMFLININIYLHNFRISLFYEKIYQINFFKNSILSKIGCKVLLKKHFYFLIF